MNQRHFIIVSAVFAILLSIVAWRSAKTYRAAEAARLALAMQRTELTTQLHHWKTELAAAKQPSTEPAVAPSNQRPPDLTASAPAAARDARAASSFVEWMEDPKVQVLFYAKERAGLAQSYGPFFQAHGLTPAQIEKLSDLIIQSRARTHDLSEINRTQGRAFNEPAMMAQRKQGEAEVQAGITEVLGETGHAELKDYARALEVRSYVGKIAGAGAIGGTPINREQAEALVRIVANTCPGYSMGGSASFGRIDWNLVEAQAQGILSPAQMKLLRTDAPGVGPSRRSNELSKAVYRAMKEMQPVSMPTGR